MTEPTGPVTTVGQRYLLLADISGYTGFLAGVENAHGVDLADEVPPGYALMGELLDALAGGVQPEFAVVKLEGDAVFATAPAATLDGRGAVVLARLRALHAAFRARRVATRQAQTHECSACSLVERLDLKMVVHRGQAVRQTVGSQTELLGPAVNVAHRLLKNTIAARIGYRPYLFLTDAATEGLHLEGIGVEHREEYPDVGTIQGRVVEFG
ncbi:MAG TPA: DUF2652 domain-containing protein [Candidatus Dormibacteraeota bacterium]|nr:DUF2652 domain-containing protein [Candidatus Dormibacteraeota bacterium]